jgi:entericidin B
MFRKAVIAVVALGIMLTASACNTVKGLGRDIESVGSAGEKATK